LKFEQRLWSSDSHEQGYQKYEQMDQGSKVPREDIEESGDFERRMGELDSGVNQDLEELEEESKKIKVKVLEMTDKDKLDDSWRIGLLKQVRGVRRGQGQQ
jgi:hypothetical protein